MVGPVVELGKTFYLTSHSVWHSNQTVRLKEVSLNKTCSQGRTVQYLSDIYPSKFCLKHEDFSAVFRFKCDLVYAIREVPAN